MSATETKLTHNEEIKTAIPTLAGTIAATIADTNTDHFSEDDGQFLKFHGSYQQDDRDLRKSGKKYLMMIRGRIPGGVMTSNQWKVFDELASTYGNNTLRITTRQSIQFHGVVKSGLRPLIKKINESLLSTLAACGDVNRNVLAPPTPAYTKAREQVFADCYQVAMAVAPQTKAYHSIWIDGVQLNLEDEANKNFVDPLYGKTYLPRKFKIAFVIPPVNDLDVYTNCLGFIAVVENDKLIGYNLAVGGGMGRSHGNVQTYPRVISATAPTANTRASNMSSPSAAWISSVTKSTNARASNSRRRNRSSSRRWPTFWDGIKPWTENGFSVCSSRWVV
jgi:sulfite reductase (NADPH) hemoprotein beta-component